MEGVSLLLCSAACVALNATIGKILSAHFDLWTTLSLRFMLPCIILSLIALCRSQWRLDYQKYGRTVLWRAFFIVTSQYAFFFCLTNSSVLEATLLFMTSPIFVLIITAINDSSPIKFKMWLSLAIGFTGILCILKPDDAMLTHWPTLIGLTSGLLNACAQICIHRFTQYKKRLRRSKRPTMLAMTLHTTLWASLATLIPVLIIDHAMPLVTLIEYDQNIEWAWFLALAILFIGNQMLRSRAYSKVKRIATLSPYLYVTVIFSGLLDWLTFGIVPDTLAYIGAACIIIGGLIMSQNPPRRRYQRHTQIQT